MRLKVIFHTLLFIVILFFSANAQDITLDNLKNLKIDQLSDEQFLKFHTRLKANGISLEKAYELMEKNGLSSVDIERIKQRLLSISFTTKNKINFPTKSIQNTDTSNVYSRKSINEENDLKTNDSVELGTIKKLNRVEKVSSKSIEIYGESFFNNPKLSFEPDLRIASPQNYILGADDELTLILTGLNEVSIKAKVSPDGNIKIPYVGLIFVNGLSIEQASTHIRSKMLKVYPALASSQTKLNINISKIKSIRVTIIGEVKQPGTYTVSSLSSLFNALYQSGGPNKNGSMREIELIRRNKVINTIDLYDFLQKGLTAGNIQLVDQDVIRIPFYQKRVIISGEIKHPAIYEMKNNEYLITLISYAGGFTENAYKANVKVFQKGAEELKLKDVSQELYENYNTQNGDSVVIGRINNRFSNRVNITGAVVRPAFYELNEGLTLKGLIEKANGLREFAFLNRGYINRIKSDLTKETVSFDLQKIVAANEPDLNLQREDQVVILSAEDLKDELSVSISGLVKQPGIYVYREGMQLGDLIAMAGGLKYNAAQQRIEIARIIPNISNQPANQLLESFILNLDSNLNNQGQPVFLKALDKITVPQLVNYRDLGIVDISGQVLYPGLYAIQKKDETPLELINRAGGLTSEASLVNTQFFRLGTRVSVDLLKKNKKNGFLLQNRDSIFIPKVFPYVEIIGGVNNPQLFEFKNTRFKFYINAAGGIASNVNLKKSFVSYPNGINNGVKSFLIFTKYPKVLKGSKIIVPDSIYAEKKKLSFAEMSALATIFTALVTLISVLK